jgi:hypothetical protein
VFLTDRAGVHTAAAEPGLGSSTPPVSASSALFGLSAVGLRDLRGMTGLVGGRLELRPVTECGDLQRSTDQPLTHGISAGWIGRPAVIRARAGNRRYRFAESLYGSDGTRTRDLRRDRPVLALPGWSGIGGNPAVSGLFVGCSCGDLRVQAGASGDLPRDMGGMLRCRS